jgi:hypothetical protein
MMEEEEKKSKYNSGLNIITRLDFLWRNSEEFKRKCQYCKWNDELDTIWLELARDLKENDFNDSIGSDNKKIQGYESKFKVFEELLKVQLPFMDSGTGFSEPTKEIITKRNEQYKILMNKQLFLARLENHLDKGTSWSESEDDFD